MEFPLCLIIRLMLMPKYGKFDGGHDGEKQQDEQNIRPANIMIRLFLLHLVVLGVVLYNLLGIV